MYLQPEGLSAAAAAAGTVAAVALMRVSSRSLEDRNMTGEGIVGGKQSVFLHLDAGEQQIDR